jgi:quercetin dioxygenase-like cupin family protein
VETLTVEQGDLVVIPPGVAHALRTTMPGWGIEFAPSELDAGDTRKVMLVAPPG